MNLSFTLYFLSISHLHSLVCLVNRMSVEQVNLGVDPLDGQTILDSDDEFCVIVDGVAFGLKPGNNAFGVIESDV